MVLPLNVCYSILLPSSLLEMYTTIEPFTTPIICAKIHCMAWLADEDGGGLLATGKCIIFILLFSFHIVFPAYFEDICAKGLVPERVVTQHIPR